MKWIDISWPISPGMTTYKDKKQVFFQESKNIETDNARETELKLNAHTGTHVDAPSHFLRNGKSIEHVSLNALMGLAHIVDCTAVKESISSADLQSYTFNPGEIVLFKTSNSFKEATAAFDYNFVYLSADAARYLAQKKVKAVGVDYLGIERNQPDHETHTILMEHDIAIIEGLRLAHVEPRSYFLICLPLAIIGAEAAPARAILLE